MIKNTFCGKFNRPQLIKRWITPIHWIAQLLSLILIGLIVIYTVDSTIQHLNKARYLRTSPMILRASHSIKATGQGTTR